MTRIDSNRLVERALADCANEPVHIPGHIQPFGWLLAFDMASGRLDYFSENLAYLLEIDPETLLGMDVTQVLDWHVMHDIRNGLSFGGAPKRRLVSVWTRGERAFNVFVWRQDQLAVVEIEELDPNGASALDVVRQQTLLVNLMRDAETTEALLSIVTRYLRSITEFDRVIVYRFDSDWNGNIIAEAKRSMLEPFMGLHFPSWDIPEQARAIMARIPLRLIGDVDAPPVALLANGAHLPPLDISLAETRGVSPVHLQYLRNMGSQATMTLSVVVEGTLWGIISFHHATPQVVPSQVRFMLTEVLTVFCLKLELLQQQWAIAASRRLDRVLEDMQGQIRRVADLESLLQQAGPELCTALECRGLAVKTDSTLFTYGHTPGEAAIEALVQRAQDSNQGVYDSACLTESLPEHVDILDGVAGAHVSLNQERWALLAFRPEVARDITWAGDPAKDIQMVEGNARLNPRGSFKTFLTKVKDQSEPWLPETLALARKLWPVLGVALAAEQRLRYMATLDQQRQLMIDELNHRVRNILSLVKSVSSQARRSNGSLDSYSNAVERRIRALAAAHDIGAGAAVESVSVKEILAQEIAPFQDSNAGRMSVKGPDIVLKAENAPIFALVIHELMTNAAKYGALSVPDGWIDVQMERREMAFVLTWKERDGPPVQAPRERGFGSTLIMNAVPYELQGSSDLTFLADGVYVQMTLPMSAMSQDAEPWLKPGKAAPTRSAPPALSPSLLSGQVLIVEDNFMIAEDLRTELTDAGFMNIHCAGSVTEAMDIVAEVTPSVALLDINLGDGQTTVPIAEVLLSWNVPFLFVTGYGDLNTLPPHLAHAPVLTKPISALDLLNVMALAVAAVE